MFTTATITGHKRAFLINKIHILFCEVEATLQTGTDPTVLQQHKGQSKPKENKINLKFKAKLDYIGVLICQH